MHPFKLVRTVAAVAIATPFVIAGCIADEIAFQRHGNTDTEAGMREWFATHIELIADFLP